MSLKVTILTLFPQMFPSFLQYSLAGKALQAGSWEYEIVNIRDFAFDKHNSVDDTPAGGGAGMVMRADVLAKAIDSVAGNPARYLMSPRGRVFDQIVAQEMVEKQHIMIVCGRFEGVDERIITRRNLQEISIGDYILSGGEPAALTILDTVIRLLPGTMNNSLSNEKESFTNNLLEYPQYTRPREFEGMTIPEVLLNGDHSKIDNWRLQQAERITKQRRPDLFEKYQKSLIPKQ